MINLDKAREWLGRIEVRSDLAAREPLAALFAALSRDEPAPEVGDTLPPLAHWLYFFCAEPHSATEWEGGGCGAFLPPIELPERRWTASRVRFHRPLRVGDAISRTSSIVDIAEKPGHGGPLAFVLMRHEVGDAEGVALSEDQHIAFRQRAAPAAPETLRRARARAIWSRHFHAEELTLFRRSAPRFNARQIQCNRSYATLVGDRPGDVVQSGLAANLLLDLLRRHAPAAQILSCDFRAIRPLADIEPFSIHGRPGDGGSAELWAEDTQGLVAMEAVAVLKDDIRFAHPTIAERRPRPRLAVSARRGAWDGNMKGCRDD